ncbi:hypothetical protein CI109_100106 [Kwoniella shandongensis]|uniref:Uncharacterized protein n=1 Tax=Kwoniella shandongensis TaxID=1734106 RepID=A0A5M6BQ00_9TREE|nr:uncharacterized protein CI109_007492 [Kwoniella shandongensis]KAA5524192.1 hypothetical protein CI109_007492 [Kwoniella shandongensis]
MDQPQRDYLDPRVVIQDFIPTLHDHLTPLSSVDTIMVPGSLHKFVSDIPLNRELYDMICREIHVVSVTSMPSFNNNPGIIPLLRTTAIYLHVVSDIGAHSEMVRTSLNYTNFAQITIPLHWHLEIRYTLNPRNVPPPLTPPERTACLNAARDLSAVISAHISRRSFFFGDLSPFDQARRDFRVIQSLSVRGQLCFYPATALPTGLHLSRDGQCYVCQDLVSWKGPWILAPIHMSKQDIHNSLDDDVRDLGGQPFEIGPGVQVEALPKERWNSAKDIYEIGRMSASLRTRLSQADSERRKKGIVSARIRLTPWNGLIPGLFAHYPLIPTWFIYTRSTPLDVGRMSAIAARQVASQLHHQPPSVAPDFSNVGQVIIILERSSSWDLSLSHRLPFKDMIHVNGAMRLEPGDLVTAVNLSTLTRLPEELDRICDIMPNLAVQGMRTSRQDAFDMVDEEDVFEGGRADEQQPDDDHLIEPSDLWYVRPDMERESAQQYLKIRWAMSQEQTFYRSSHYYMQRMIDEDVDLSDLKQAIERYRIANGLGQVYGFGRISKGERGQNTAHSDSINRQKLFIQLVCPANTTMIKLDQISIYRDGSRVTAELSKLNNCLLIVSSVDRLTRNRKSWHQLRTLCESNNIHVISLLFPPTAISQLCHMPNPIFEHDDSTRKRFHQLAPTASHPRSGPCLWPTLITGPHVSVNTIQVVEHRVFSSEMFVSGFLTSAYRGDPAIRLPPATTRHVRAFNQAALLAIQNMVRIRAGPTWQGNVTVATYHGLDALDCPCTRGNCVPGCVCVCRDVCGPNYEDILEDQGECPELCPCGLRHGQK